MLNAINKKRPSFFFNAQQEVMPGSVSYRLMTWFLIVPTPVLKTFRATSRCDFSAGEGGSFLA